MPICPESVAIESVDNARERARLTPEHRYPANIDPVELKGWAEGYQDGEGF